MVLADFEFFGEQAFDEGTRCWGVIVTVMFSGRAVEVLWGREGECEVLHHFLEVIDQMLVADEAIEMGIELVGCIKACELAECALGLDEFYECGFFECVAVPEDSAGVEVC